MLVLSRKEGERLVLGGKVIVTVVKLDGGRVKLGIEAPPEIGIQREEILDRPLLTRTVRQDLRMDEPPIFAACW